MRKTITAISLLALLASSSTFAATASKQETAGVGAGGVIGAIAGGPVGFIIGAAIGAKIGDTMHKKTTTIDELTFSLDNSLNNASDLELDVQSLNTDVDSLGVELERMREFDRPQLINLLQAGIAMDLLFRTDEHALADTTGDRLAQLAGSLASMPDIRVQLDGFADERGDELRWDMFLPDEDGITGATSESARVGNTDAHQLEGQNVLFLDSHVGMEKRSYAGTEQDNIYTVAMPNAVQNTQQYYTGVVFSNLTQKPTTRKDSYLINEGSAITSSSGGSTGGGGR